MTFTTATLTASFILFGGFNTTNSVNTISLLCGFLIIFTGVYLLNISRSDPHGLHNVGPDRDGIATDPISGLQTRRSMQARRSLEPHRLSLTSNGDYGRSDRDGLIRAYDEEANGGLGLDDLAEDSDYDRPPLPVRLNGHANGNTKRSFSEPIESERSGRQ